MIESLAIYCLVIALILLFANPFMPVHTEQRYQRPAETHRA